MKDVLIPASRNVLQLGPLKGNELANSPLYRNSFLNGATVYIDPRQSGVRADGVAWIGSPLLDAASYYAQVGVGVAELMTKGGTVTLGAQGFAGTGTAALAPDVTVGAGAAIDISGGWVRYQAGQVRTTQLVTSDGHIVDIAHADPNIAYAGLFTGYTLNHGRWGVTESWVSPLTGNGRYVAEYTEGRDAGALTVKASAIAFEGDLFADAFAGDRQRLGGSVGTAASKIFGDSRGLQASSGQRPAGGFLYIQALTETTGGADVVIVDGAADRPAAGLDTIVLSDGLLSDSGLGQVSVHTSGKVTIEQGADVELGPGGVFDVLAGRTLTVAGSITVPSGRISLETFDSRGLSDHTYGGSAFGDKAVADRLGDYDVVVTGSLSTRGLWVNDYGQFASGGDGGGYLDGGAISLYAAPNLAAAFDRDGQRLANSTYADPDDAAAPRSAQDISGSILVDAGARLDVSGGGRIRPDGSFDFSARGGDLALVSETTYFQLSTTTSGRTGGLSGLRVGGLLFTDSSGSETPYVSLNPDRINAHVSFDPGSILAHGFAGGGTFALTAPQVAFAAQAGGRATVLPLEFFADAGFGAYDITSYKTALLANQFANSLGGSNALLATQTLTVGAGQVLRLSQSLLPSLLDVKQADALHALGTGGDLYSVLTPAVPADAWDRRAVDLTLGGLLELHVAQGGRIEGEAGTHLTVAKLFNEGTIRLPGGKITQNEVLPLIYGADGLRHGVTDLAQAFSTDAAGRFTEDGPNRLGLRNEDGDLLTNAEVADSHALYLLGLLDEGEGVRLAAGSLTDLSGTVIVNPRAALNGIGLMIRDGRVIAGGTLEAVPSHVLAGLPFRANEDLLSELSLDDGQRYGLIRAAQRITLDKGSVLDLSGVADRLDLPTRLTGSLNGLGYAAAPVWSDGGTLSAPNGVLMAAGATVRAEGGAPLALGGKLEVSDLTLVQHDGKAAVVDTLSADQIEAAGFDTLRVFGSITGKGDVSLSLGRAFLLESKPFALDPRFDLADGSVRDGYLPTIRSLGGTLRVDAGYIRFGSGLFDTVSDPAAGVAGSGKVSFEAKAIDIVGALLIDRSVADARFEATGDLRLIGARPWQSLLPTTAALPTTLNGQVAANGNLTFAASRVYPTTGSAFQISSTAATGQITFARAGTSTGPVPLSAGASLVVQAATIVQGGALYAPLGTITLGGNEALTRQDSSTDPVRFFARPPRRLPCRPAVRHRSPPAANRSPTASRPTGPNGSSHRPAPIR
ncbi:hypothetical protein D3874_05455 [Oleomonas cavernae]|uniref:Filamentous hemagglutinin n=1 Tax=Oleomonas cavernae TaxID=2320859 RepID=A0A418W941_9PROT|nr:hypothetical protein [Oleomonas cavernae]RJF86535.1 hypothetical protein D3874_05455 [Oleomonas cavernae]